MEVEINKIYTTNYGEKYRVLGELPIRDNNRRNSRGNDRARGQRPQRSEKNN